jgi:DNA-binding CsgD family transcriptional regulator
MANINGFNGKSKRNQWRETKTARTNLLDAVNGAADSASVLLAAENQASRKLPLITAAEHRVLALVAQARSNKEIASELGISPATVKRHMEKILKKLKLRNRVEAAIFGLMLNGCPHVSNSGCVIRKLCRVGEDSASCEPIAP